MIDYSTYYQRDPQSPLAVSAARFPKNHVQYSKFLKPIEWIDRAYGLFGTQAFRFKKIILKEFDRIAPLDEYMGSRDELNQVRNLVMLFCESIDNNPYLSTCQVALDTGYVSFLLPTHGVLVYCFRSRRFIRQTSIRSISAYRG